MASAQASVPEENFISPFQESEKLVLQICEDRDAYDRAWGAFFHDDGEDDWQTVIRGQDASDVVFVCSAATNETVRNCENADELSLIDLRVSDLKIVPSTELGAYPRHMGAFVPAVNRSAVDPRTFVQSCPLGWVTRTGFPSSDAAMVSANYGAPGVPGGAMQDDPYHQWRNCTEHQVGVTTFLYGDDDKVGVYVKVYVPTDPDAVDPPQVFLTGDFQQTEENTNAELLHHMYTEGVQGGQWDHAEIATMANASRRASVWSHPRSCREFSLPMCAAPHSPRDIEFHGPQVLQKHSGYYHIVLLGAEAELLAGDRYQVVVQRSGAETGGVVAPGTGVHTYLQDTIGCPFKNDTDVPVDGCSDAVGGTNFDHARSVVSALEIVVAETTVQLELINFVLVCTEQQLGFIGASQPINSTCVTENAPNPQHCDIECPVGQWGSPLPACVTCFQTTVATLQNSLVLVGADLEAQELSLSLAIEVSDTLQQSFPELSVWIQSPDVYESLESFHPDPYDSLGIRDPGTQRLGMFPSSTAASVNLDLEDVQQRCNGGEVEEDVYTLPAKQDQVVYRVDVRTYTPEGTLDAMVRRVDELIELRQRSAEVSTTAEVGSPEWVRDLLGFNVLELLPVYLREVMLQHSQLDLSLAEQSVYLVRNHNEPDNAIACDLEDAEFTCRGGANESAAVATLRTLRRFVLQMHARGLGVFLEMSEFENVISDGYALPEALIVAVDTVHVPQSVSFPPTMALHNLSLPLTPPAWNTEVAVDMCQTGVADGHHPWSFLNTVFYRRCEEVEEVRGNRVEFALTSADSVEWPAVSDEADQQRIEATRGMMQKKAAGMALIALVDAVVTARAPFTKNSTDSISYGSYVTQFYTLPTGTTILGGQRFPAVDSCFAQEFCPLHSSTHGTGVYPTPLFQDQGFYSLFSMEDPSEDACGGNDASLASCMFPEIDDEVVLVRSLHEIDCDFPDVCRDQSPVMLSTSYMVRPLFLERAVDTSRSVNNPRAYVWFSPLTTIVEVRSEIRWPRALHGLPAPREVLHPSTGDLTREFLGECEALGVTSTGRSCPVVARPQHLYSRAWWRSLLLQRAVTDAGHSSVYEQGFEDMLVMPSASLPGSSVHDDNDESTIPFEFRYSSHAVREVHSVHSRFFAQGADRVGVALGLNVAHPGLPLEPQDGLYPAVTVDETRVTWSMMVGPDANGGRYSDWHVLSDEGVITAFVQSDLSELRTHLVHTVSSHELSGERTIFLHLPTNLDAEVLSSVAGTQTQRYPVAVTPLARCRMFQVGGVPTSQSYASLEDWKMLRCTLPALTTLVIKTFRAHDLTTPMLPHVPESTVEAAEAVREYDMALVDSAVVPGLVRTACADSPQVRRENDACVTPIEAPITAVMTNDVVLRRRRRIPSGDATFTFCPLNRRPSNLDVGTCDDRRMGATWFDARLPFELGTAEQRGMFFQMFAPPHRISNVTLQLLVTHRSVDQNCDGDTESIGPVDFDMHRSPDDPHYMVAGLMLDVDVVSKLRPLLAAQSTARLAMDNDLESFLLNSRFEYRYVMTAYLDDDDDGDSIPTEATPSTTLFRTDPYGRRTNRYVNTQDASHVDEWTVLDRPFYSNDLRATLQRRANATLLVANLGSSGLDGTRVMYQVVPQTTTSTMFAPEMFLRGDEQDSAAGVDSPPTNAYDVLRHGHLDRFDVSDIILTGMFAQHSSYSGNQHSTHELGVNLRPSLRQADELAALSGVVYSNGDEFRMEPVSHPLGWSDCAAARLEAISTSQHTNPFRLGGAPSRASPLFGDPDFDLFGDPDFDLAVRVRGTGLVDDMRLSFLDYVIEAHAHGARVLIELDVGASALQGPIFRFSTERDGRTDAAALVDLVDVGGVTAGELYFAGLSLDNPPLDLGPSADRRAVFYTRQELAATTDITRAYGRLDLTKPQTREMLLDQLRMLIEEYMVDGVLVRNEFLFDSDPIPVPGAAPRQVLIPGAPEFVEQARSVVDSFFDITFMTDVSEAVDSFFDILYRTSDSNESGLTAQTGGATLRGWDGTFKGNAVDHDQIPLRRAELSPGRFARQVVFTESAESTQTVQGRMAAHAHRCTFCMSALPMFATQSIPMIMQGQEMGVSTPTVLSMLDPLNSLSRNIPLVSTSVGRYPVLDLSLPNSVDDPSTLAFDSMPSPARVEFTSKFSQLTQMRTNHSVGVGGDLLRYSQQYTQLVSFRQWHGDGRVQRPVYVFMNMDEPLPGVQSPATILLESRWVSVQLDDEDRSPGPGQGLHIMLEYTATEGGAVFCEVAPNNSLRMDCLLPPSSLVIMGANTEYVPVGAQGVDDDLECWDVGRNAFLPEGECNAIEPLPTSGPPTVTPTTPTPSECAAFCSSAIILCPSSYVSENVCLTTCAGFRAGGSPGDTSGNTLVCRATHLLWVTDPQDSDCDAVSASGGGVCVDSTPPAPTTAGPTSGPTSAGPTSGPTSAGPTSGPTSAGPTSGPTSVGPTSVPVGGTSGSSNVPVWIWAPIAAGVMAFVLLLFIIWWCVSTRNSSRYDRLPTYNRRS